MAADLPTDVAELQARLQKARDEYRRLLGQRVEFEKRAVYNEAVVMHALAVLNFDQEPGLPVGGEYPPPDHPLFVAAIDAATAGAAAVRMRRLLERVVELVDEDEDLASLGKPGDELVEQIRTELSQP